MGEDSEPTSAKNLIRLYSIAYVNDPKAGKRLKTFASDEFPNPLTELFNVSSGTHEAISWQGKEFLVFVACFSLQCDSLNLWRFYGRNAPCFQASVCQSSNCTAPRFFV